MPCMLLTWIWIGENWKKDISGTTEKLEDKLYTVVLNVLAIMTTGWFWQWLKMSLFLKKYMPHTMSTFYFQMVQHLVKEVIWRSPNVKNWWLYMKGYCVNGIISSTFYRLNFLNKIEVKMYSLCLMSLCYHGL